MLALGLIGFLIVTVGVVARRSTGQKMQRELDALQRSRTQLRGEVVRIEADIRSASSFNRLARVVESSLGMRVPADTQVIDLQVTEVARVAP